MKYLLVTALNQVYKADEITRKEIDECEQGNLSIIEIETERELLLEDKWTDISEWDSRTEEDIYSEEKEDID